MRLIVCLDDRDGMTFLGRRQSQDALLRQDMLAYVDGHELWMNSYSAAQFGNECNISVSEYIGHCIDNIFTYVFSRKIKSKLISAL